MVLAECPLRPQIGGKIYVDPQVASRYVNRLLAGELTRHSTIAGRSPHILHGVVVCYIVYSEVFIH